MSDPTQTCELCGRVQVVTPDGRGFPPDIAKRRLARLCKANGCPSRPVYRAGMSGRVQAVIIVERLNRAIAEGHALREGGAE